MKCPACGSRSRVIDSRESGDCVRRRRCCDRCSQRWTTYELIPGMTDEGRVLIDETALKAILSRITAQVIDGLGAEARAIAQPRRGRHPGVRRPKAIREAMG